MVVILLPEYDKPSLVAGLVPSGEGWLVEVGGSGFEGRDNLLCSVFMVWSFLQGGRSRFQFCRGGVQNLSGIFLYFTFTRYAPTNRVGTPTKRVGTSDFLGV